MSDIVFKGDTIKEFGEYLPNIYIDRVTITNSTAYGFSMDIEYSLLFHVSDEVVDTDIADLVNKINLHFVVSEQLESDEPLSREMLVEDIIPGVKGMTNEDFKPITTFYEDSKRDIIYNILNDNVVSDVYDSNDRRVLITKGTFSVIHNSLTSLSGETSPFLTYLSAFTSIGTISKIASISSNTHNTGIVDVLIGDVAHEKLFTRDGSKMIIDLDEETSYFDSNNVKYPEVPILALDKLYYKTETVTREFILDKFNTLISRFESDSNSDIMNSVLESMKFVVATQEQTDLLLVEMDKVRRAFPNKTNNNRVGNLYAALSKLLININSSFLKTEEVFKQRITSGKIIDAREVEFEIYEAETSDITGSLYIPNDGFFIERNYWGEDDGQDLFYNDGFFVLRSEAFLKEHSNISKVINIENLIEFLPNIKPLLFSYFQLARVELTKKIKAAAAYGRISQNILKFDAGGVPREREPEIVFHSYKLNGNIYATTGSVSSVVPRTDGPLTIEPLLEEYYLTLENEQKEATSVFRFVDLDYFERTELDGNFLYNVKIIYRDKTLKLAKNTLNLFKAAITDFRDYKNLAYETCNYNNLPGRFNDFFIKEIHKFYDEQDSQYPWESSVILYSLIQYILTNKFEDLDSLKSYSKTLIRLVSPAGGSLTSMDKLLEDMRKLRDEMENLIGDVRDASDEKLSFETRISSFINSIEDLEGYEVIMSM